MKKNIVTTRKRKKIYFIFLILFLTLKCLRISISTYEIQKNQFYFIKFIFYQFFTSISRSEKTLVTLSIIYQKKIHQKSHFLGFNKKSSPIVVKIYISQKWNLFFKCFNSRVKSVWITPTLSLFIKLNGCLVKQGQSSLQRPQTGWSVYINLFCIIYTHHSYF